MRPLPLQLLRTTVATLGFALVSSRAEAREVGRSMCPRSGNTIVVFSFARELWLCRDGAQAARYPVALGRGGLGKRRLGDGRTPVGTYPLGAPRPSARYGTFIPIAYPTPEQAAQGFSGFALGIHGPPRGMVPSEYPLTRIDWTLGCIATGSDAEMEQIAGFVRERRPLLVIR